MEDHSKWIGDLLGNNFKETSVWKRELDEDEDEGFEYF